MLRRVLTSAAVVAAVLTVAGPASGRAPAQTPTDQADPSVPVSWSVAPISIPGEEPRANFVLEADPGDTITDALVVTNSSTVNLVLGVYASDAFNTAEGGTDLLAADDEPVDLGSWTTPDQSSITVPAGQSVTVPFTVEVPDDATSGDHVGGLVTTLSLTEPDADGNRITVERRLGTRIYLRVDGEVDPQLTFTGLTTEYHATWNPFAAGSMEVTYGVENTGNVRLRATRQISVQGSLGTSERTAEAADMPELLPGNSYEFTQTISGVWPAMSTEVQVELDPYEPSGVALDPAPAPAVARTEINLVPVSQVLLLVLIVLIAVFALWRRGRYRRRLAASVDSAVNTAVAKAMARPGAAPDSTPPPPPEYVPLPPPEHVPPEEPRP